MLHKKLNQNLSTCVLQVKNWFMLSKKRLRFNIILKLITCWEINQAASKSQLDFLDNNCKKGLKQKKEHNHRLLYIEVSLGSKFQLQQTILIFWNKFLKKKEYLSKTKRANITIEFLIFELDYIKFQLKLTIFIFWTKLAQKRYFQPKTDAKNTAIEFYIFDLV